MLVVDNGAGRDPALNLALEEDLMRHGPTGADMLLFYINDRAVVIGRNQVPYAEMGLRAAARRRVAVVRRTSGGGTVYHDPGNLNFCWIQSRREDPFPSPAEAAWPVLQGLRDLGLPVRLNQRHDILLENRKITGIAQYRTKDKCLTHGTLLVAADLEALEDVLQPDCDVPAARGRKSVRSKVTNLTRYRPTLTIGALQEALLGAFAAFHGRAVPLSLDASHWARIRAAADAKYRSWDWNVGRSPAFAIRRRADFAWGRGEAVMHIQRGVMTRIVLSLPEGAPSAIFRLVSDLEGQPYHPATIARRMLECGSAVPNVGEDRRSLAEWICPSWYWWG